jgi:two-component system sensor histidine kinase AlgZ
MARMSDGRRLRAFLDGPLRYAWVYLTIPALIALALVEDVGWGALPAAFLGVLLVFVCQALPMHLCYDHLFERLAGARALSLRGFAFHALAIPFWVLVGSELGIRLATPLVPGDVADFLRVPLRVASFFGAPVIVAGIMGHARHQELRTRELQAQRAALAAQVQALQARIQPHFLFNCLNGVAGLIEEDPKRAEAALERLADLFRYTLEASSRPLVPLARELAGVEGFVELETLRFADRLRVALRVEPGMGEVPVPPLSIQPLVENAVLHGVVPRREGGRVEVDLRREGDCLRVSVEDDGPGPGRSGHRGAGAALDDLRRRLALLYGDAASVSVGVGPLGGCRVELRLPLDPGALRTAGGAA